MNFRSLRVKNLIQTELGKIFTKDIEFGAFVTIADIEVDAKLEEAIVKVSVIPEEKGKEVFDFLEKEKKSLQFKLLKKMNIKPMPRLKFGLIRGEELMKKGAEAGDMIIEDKVAEEQE